MTNLGEPRPEVIIRDLPGAAASGTDRDLAVRSIVGTSTFLDPERPGQVQRFSDVWEVAHTAKTAAGRQEWAYLNGNRGIDVRLTADTAAIQSDESVNDSTLVVKIGANRSFSFWGMIAFNSGATPDIKFGFKDPSSVGASIRWGMTPCISTGNWAIDWTGGVGVVALAAAGAAADGSVWIYGTGAMGATDGDLTLQWAQNTSTASDSKLLVGSFIRTDLY